MANPVNIALVGMGWWGQKMLAVLQAAPADIRVVRAVEPNVESVRALCEGKGIAHIVTGGRFSIITVDELKLIREAYKKLGQPLLEMTVPPRRWAQMGLG